MENQPGSVQWFRPRRAQPEAAPQQPQRPRGPPIRQASIAMGRAGLLPADVEPRQPPTTPPSPKTAVTTTAAATATTIQQQPPRPAVQPAVVSPQQQTKAQPVARPPTPPVQQKEALPRKPAVSDTDLSQLVPKPAASPSPPATPTLRPIVTTRSLTPPMSPKVIKPSSPTPTPSTRISFFSPTPTSSPKVSIPRASSNMWSNPEPETTVRRQESSAKNGARISNNGNEEQYKKDHEIETKPVILQTDVKPSYSPLNNAKHPFSQNDRRIITLAGDNMGAVLELSSPPKQYAQKLQVHRIGGQEEMAGLKDGEENGVTKPKTNVALVNSNVQTINNSILYNATYSHRSPGVHINFIRRKPKETEASS